MIYSNWFFNIVISNFHSFEFWRKQSFFGRQNQSKISAKNFEIDFSNFIEGVIAGLSSAFDNVMAK